MEKQVNIANTERSRSSAPAKNSGQIRRMLFDKLKKAHCFWSYDVSSVQSISDASLIEMVMLHLDVEDINKLFLIFPAKVIKACWIERLIPQREYIYSLNVFIACYCFGIKRPNAYVKAMATRQQNKLAI